MALLVLIIYSFTDTLSHSPQKRSRQTTVNLLKINNKYYIRVDKLTLMFSVNFNIGD